MRIVAFFTFLITILVVAQFAIAASPYSKFEYIEPQKNGHGCILDEDIIVYSSKLYFEGKYLESIELLKKLKLDHDSIYWLWKNELAVADKQTEKSETKYIEYIKANNDYFVYQEELKRYLPSKKRLEESKSVYPNNEFLPEMETFYKNIEKIEALPIRPKE